MIEEVLLENEGNLNICTLCSLAQVSRSGYYVWKFRVRTVETNPKELKDREDFNLILEVYNRRGIKKGARTICMILSKDGHPMNLKKVRRLMKKYGLFCPIRKPNPYKKMMKALEQSTIAPNLLERRFREFGPRVVLLTDITYLFYANHQKCYLSSIKDAYTKEILAWVLSISMEEDFVLETVNMLLTNHKKELNTEALVHSDQGIHYKVVLFKDLLKDNSLRQSMSRKANCWDNAPQESFHGHLKDEIDLNKCQTFEEVKNMIENYIDYYNNERPQWGLAKLTPSEYYQYSITNIYPSRINSENSSL